MKSNIHVLPYTYLAHVADKFAEEIKTLSFSKIVAFMR